MRESRKCDIRPKRFSAKPPSVLLWSLTEAELTASLRHKGQVQSFRCLTSHNSDSTSLVKVTRNSDSEYLEPFFFFASTSPLALLASGYLPTVLFLVVETIISNVLQILSDAFSSMLKCSKGHDGRAADPHGEPHGSGFTGCSEGCSSGLLMFRSRSEQMYVLISLLHKNTYKYVRTSYLRIRVMDFIPCGALLTQTMTSLSQETERIYHVMNYVVDERKQGHKKAPQDTSAGSEVNLK